MKDTLDVFLAGVFDCFHRGHLNLIYKASRLGRLTVGVVKDRAVRKQKGEGRPVYDEDFRYSLINSLKPVYSACLINGFSFPENIFKDYDIICIGEDQGHFSNIKDIPFDKLIVLPRTPNVSTTVIVERLRIIK